MVRLADVHEAGRKSLEALECPAFEDEPFLAPRPASARRVALVSTAGLITQGETPFKRDESSYREFSDTTDNADIVVSHVSINFDRTAALKNIESIFPRNTLREMARDNEIGSAAKTNYSFMGATDPALMEEEAKELCVSLKSEGVDTVVLLPV